METDRTGSFDYDMVTTAERKSILIEKIESDMKEVDQLREQSINTPEIRKLIGKKDSLKRLVRQIECIDENSISLVPLGSRTIGVPQHLNTDDKFLNAAYFQAMSIRDRRRGFDGSAAASPEGEAGKREVMSKIMDDIRALV